MSGVADRAANVRRRLAALGRQRQKLDNEDEALMGEVGEVLREAYGLISVTEAAELLHMHRTTVYRVYHPHA